VVPAPAEVDSLEELPKEDGAEAEKDEKDKLTLPNVKDLLKGVQGFGPGRSFIAAAQEEVQNLRGSLLGDLLVGLAEPNLNDTEKREATIVSQFVRILQAGQNFRTERMPNVSGVLIDIAAARLRSETARVEAERLKELSRLAGLRVRALSRELVLLHRADALMATSPGDDSRLARMDAALRLYSESWTKYRAPQTTITLDETNLGYSTWSARERATIEASYALLEPALNELHEYGQGGITAGNVASLLSTLGIGIQTVEGD
jgi:hypothetical protein